MLRIRQEDGTARTLADSEFIEVLHPVSGNIVQVLHWSSRFNMLREILPGSERARNYATLFPDAKIEFDGKDGADGVA